MPWSHPDHEASAVEAIERGVISGDPDVLAEVPEPQQSSEHAARVSALSILNQLGGAGAVVETPWTPGAYPPVDPPVDESTPPPDTPTGVPGAWDILFTDTFDSFDTDNWQPRYEWTPTPINQELAAFVPGNVTADGILRLTATEDPVGDQPYSSGVVTSYGKVAFTYGVAEARIKFPAGPGLFPAFWMLPDNHNYPPEIDIVEYGGAKPDSVQVGYYPAPLNYNTYTGAEVPMPDVAGEWHTYSVEWDEGKLVFRIDGIEVHRTENSNVPQQALYLIFNLAVIGDNSWAGPVDDTTQFPASLEVDWVRVWQKHQEPPTTPPGNGTYQHTVEIAPGVRQVTVESDTRYVMPERRMEGNGASYAFRSNGQIQHVMIDGIEMTGYDPPQQAGVIQLAPNDNNLAGDDVIIQGVHIHDCDEVAIKTRIDNVVIRDFLIEDMGRLGLSVGHGADPDADGGLIENGKIIRCNADGRNSWGFEAGGSKFWQSTNLVCRNIESYGHVGPGLWADKDNIGWVVQDCHLHDCRDAPGLFQEIGGSYHFLNNLIEDCGKVGESWLWDAGIQVSSSNDGLIEGNTIRRCGHGISLVQQNRGGGAYGTHELRDNVVRNNDVSDSVASGLARADQAYEFVFTTNDWYGNRYDSGHRFAMRNQWGDANFWRSYFPQDAV